MTRLENCVDSKTLYKIGKLFLDEYISSFEKAPKKVIIELRGDSHFASHEFMDWTHDRWYVRYLTGLSGNSVLLSMMDKPRRRAENDYRKAQEAEDERYETLTRLGFHGVRHERVVIRRYYKLEYKAESWKLGVFTVAIVVVPFFV